MTKSLNHRRDFFWFFLFPLLLLQILMAHLPIPQDPYYGDYVLSTVSSALLQLPKISAFSARVCILLLLGSLGWMWCQKLCGLQLAMLLVLSSAWEIQRDILGSLTVSTTELLLIPAAFSYFVSLRKTGCALSLKRSNHFLSSSHNPGKNPEIYGWILFGVLIILSAMFSSDRILAFKQMMRLSAIGLSFAIAITAQAQENERLQFLWMLGLNAALILLWGMFHGGLATGTPLQHHNLLGAYLGICVFPVCSLYLREGRPVNALPALIIIAGILLSLSRSAYLGAFVGALLLSLSLWRNPVWRRRLLLTACAAALTILLLPESQRGWERIQQVFSERKSPEVSARIQFWKTSLQVIRDRPIFGVGPGNWRVAYKQYLDREAYEPYLNWTMVELFFRGGVHNTYLQMAIEMGLPALFIFLILLGRLIMRLFRRDLLGIATAVGCVSFFTQSFFDVYLWNHSLGVCLACVLGVAFSKKAQ